MDIKVRRFTEERDAAVTVVIRLFTAKGFRKKHAKFLGCPEAKGMEAYHDEAPILYLHAVDTRCPLYRYFA